VQVEASVHTAQPSEHERHFPPLKYLPNTHETQFVALLLHSKHPLSHATQLEPLRNVPGKHFVQTEGDAESQAAHRLVLLHIMQDFEALSKANPPKQPTQTPVEQSAHPKLHLTIFPSMMATLKPYYCYLCSKSLELAYCL
jgi:hypothetical protein